MKVLGGRETLLLNHSPNASLNSYRILNEKVHISIKHENTLKSQDMPRD